MFRPRINPSKTIPIAKGFVAYLEENQLKETKKRSEFREIYRDFITKYETNGISFGEALNAMCFHLNLCQQIRGKVIFGGGEEAALAMLNSDDDDDDWEKEVHNFPCNTCRKPMPNCYALEKHHSSINHRQQIIFKTIREMLERQELILDKNDIQVTSSPEGESQSGVIETVVQLGGREDIVLTVHNTGSPHNVVHLKDITLLWSTSLFVYTEIKEIPFYKSVIKRGAPVSFVIGCKPKKEYGFSYVPVVLRFCTPDNENDYFYIMRFLCIRSVSDIYDDLKKTSEYIGPAKHQVVPSDITTEPGLGLPPLRRNGLFGERLEKYFVVGAVKEAVRGPNKLAEGVLRLKVEQPLAFSNYKDKFSTLIQIEELQMVKDIRNYDMHGETFTKDGKLLILKVPGLAENRPSVLRGDRILAYEQGLRNQRFEGIVHKVELLNVKLGFGESMPFINGKKFDIQFTFNRMSIQMQHRAHERVIKNPGLEHVLFQTPATISTRGSNNFAIRSYYDRYLNDEQKTAVNNITNGTSRPAPYLVFGPPGTGKTVTFVEAIKQVYDHQPNAVILACAPENSAADLIVESLLATSRIEKRKILRMYATSRPWEFVPQVLKDGKVINFNDKEVFYPTVEEMKDYRVIVTTLVTAGRLVSAQLGNNHFTHIFIDEAGHAVEPECVIPIADLLNPISGQLVLAGDPKQLGPVLRSPIGQKNGLGLSLLERLMTTCNVYKRSFLTQQYNDQVMTKLVNNYRSHRDIIEIPKQLFYDDELNECAGDFRNIMLGWEELPNPDCPIIIHPVYGTDEREARSPSFFNVAEVETIEKYLRKLLDDNVRSKRMKMIRPEMIGIISPYKRQVQKIQTMLEKKNFKNIKVGSVEEFQGQERRIIIVSTVRSTKQEYLDMDKEFGLGFLDNPKRFNVAITRAQALLILIGNTEMLNRDGNWSRFLMFCCDKGAFVKTVQMKQEGNDIASLMKRLGLPSQNALPEDNSDISMRELQESPEWTRHE